MAFTAGQVSDLYYLLGYADSDTTLDNALARVLPSDTETRCATNITAAKAAIVSADALLPLVGIDRDGNSYLTFERERKKWLAKVRRLVGVIANDLNVDVLHDITNESPRVNAADAYAPWG